MGTKLPKMRSKADSLVAQFAEAGLPLEMAKEPIQQVFARTTLGGTTQPETRIFQMDIQRRFRGNERSEYFRIWRGEDNNLVQVVNIDAGIKQLVLFVRETERTFEERAPSYMLEHQFQRHGANWFKKMLQEHHLTEKDVVQATGLDNPRTATVILRRKTTGNKRHFLCGVDERQLFIAQLPRGVTTVQDAHNALKTTRVTLAEGKVDGRTERQGEWFFVNTTPEERRAINEAIRKGELAIHHDVAIGRNLNGRNPVGFGTGKPHVAEDLVHRPGHLLTHGFPINAEETYVRGKIRHPDHATKKFAEWRRVIRNNEPGGGQNSLGSNGIAWVD